MCAERNKRSWIIRVKDILDSIHKIETYIAGLTYEQFETDSLRIDAVIRNLEIMGEAAGHIPLEIQGKYPDLAWFEMRGMRNVVMHEYFGVSLAIIWKTVTQDLTLLKAGIAQILQDHDTAM
jgi:uncharacterized protein with HEPN domain